MSTLFGSTLVLRTSAISLTAIVALTLCVFQSFAEEVPEVASTEVVVPVRLDYPLLEQLLVSQLFTGEDGSRELLNDPSGCSEILVSNPGLTARDSQLELLGDLRARIGVGARGSCATMLSWEGRIGIAGNPEIRNEGTALGFTPGRVWLLDATGQPISNDSLQSLAEASVRAIFSRFVVDLKPQLQSVGDVLPEVLPRYSRQQIEALLASLRVAGLSANAATLDVDIAFAIEPLPEPLKPEAALSEDELASWEERWQLMDSLLVLAVKHYAASTQLQELRDALLETLIESRYRLRDALQENADTGTDTVREWFLEGWHALTPIIRQIGSEQPGQEHLLFLSVIAAGDALEALDQLGPSVGLDISTNGLRRMARMIIGGAGEELLQYSEEVDPQLRQLLDESLKATSPPSAWRFDLSPFPKAVAADAGRLNSWAPRREDLPEYLPLVARLMDAAQKKVADSRKLDAAYQTLFRNLVLATAWQESCWRHYVISDDRKLVPLRSGTGDVGLMQVNERVWRGFYSQQQLRWDIDYNSAAGAEVLIDYLLKYAIRKGEHRQPGGLANLARASYSAYNGGPSQVSRYRSSEASAYGRKVDQAFWEKYQQVAAGNELAVSTCLGGNMTGAVATKSRAPAASSTSGRFTLQLAVFSSEASANTFIAKNALGTAAQVRKRSKGSNAQYLVIYGDYPTREQADAARRKLPGGMEPWIRPLADL